ncbi:MAG TPA: bifunctional DNA-formamidopyrimidine glycosylase/DNA-(apurinic or apyrimidinic site) lyase [Candidatus Acidoferrales bacterium]|nr:bifunctional DNA-formamidopyrimidine glycosylase/DNA-(apurinic or apyrimidinic site) lyase [Candidatus Acidoferrales bacterium]
MPELPEVETVVRGLKAVLPGRQIVGVRLGKTDFIDDPVALERDVPGSRITQVRRHGKFLVLELNRDSARDAARKLSLLVHLGMTGQLVVYPAEAPARPHTHVFFTLDDGRELRYTDIRRFGRMCLVPRTDQAKVLGPLGLDPLEASQAQFAAAIHAHKSHIKALLLDQTVLRGMGNIYTDESLWRVKIHPRRLGANLTPKELRRLHRAMQDVLNEAIRSRGSSISDYVDSAGEQGEFQLKHRVYDREDKKCFRCGTPIRRIIVAGRSSYFCPHCQRAPRKRTTQRSKRTVL